MLYDWLQHINFAYPLFFGLFVLIPLMIFWYLQKIKKWEGTIIISSVKNFSDTRSWKNIFRHALFVLRILAIISLITGLARPQIRNDEQMVNGEGIDIILCLDISGTDP